MTYSEGDLEKSFKEATSRIEAQLTGAPPDLSSAMRRRLRTRARVARMTAAVGVIALIAGVVLAAKSPRDSSENLTASTRHPGTVLVGLPDGSRFRVDNLDAISDRTSPRVTISSPIKLNNSCCPYTSVSFGARVELPTGKLFDSWTTSTGVQFNVYRRPGGVPIATSTIGPFAMTIDLRSSSPETFRKDLDTVSVDLVHGFPVLGKASRPSDSNIRPSASFEFDANTPLMTLGESTCQGASVTDPVDADFPTTNRCFPDAGVEINLQDSQPGASIEALHRSISRLDVHRISG